jgi:hypothetical protein
VTSPYSDQKTAPRLSGTPVVDAVSPRKSDDKSSRAFSPTKVSLGKGTSRLTFGLTSAQPTANRVVDVTLRYAVAEIEHRIQDMTGIAKYQRSAWLSLILPIAPVGEEHPAARVPMTTTLIDAARIGRLTIPVPLRACPSPPTMIEQSANPMPLVESASLTRLKQWEYAFSFTHPTTAQDTRFVSVTFNSPAPQAYARAAGKSIRPLFEALAQFNEVYQLVQQDLNVLPMLSPGQTSPAAVKAATVFAELVKRVADAWKQAPVVRAAEPGSGITLDFTVTSTSGNGSSDTMTLTSKTDLPSGIAWPDLYAGVREAEHAMTPEKALSEANGRSQTYRYPSGIPSSTPTYVWVFPNLDATWLQSGIAAAHVVRNTNLGGEDKITNSDFVYKTAIAEFANPLLPLLVRRQVTPINGSLRFSPGDSVATALQRVFAELFTSKPWTATVKLSGRYGYRIQPETDQLITQLPIFLITNHALTDSDIAGFTEKVESTIKAWRDQHNPIRNAAALYFNLTIYVSQIPNVDQPILDLHNLCLGVRGL